MCAIQPAQLPHMPNWENPNEGYEQFAPANAHSLGSPRFLFQQKQGESGRRDTPRKFNMEPEKRNLLFQNKMFRFHVELKGCKPNIVSHNSEFAQFPIPNSLNEAASLQAFTELNESFDLQSTASKELKNFNDL